MTTKTIEVSIEAGSVLEIVAKELEASAARKDLESGKVLVLAFRKARQGGVSWGAFRFMGTELDGNQLNVDLRRAIREAFEMAEPGGRV